MTERGRILRGTDAGPGLVTISGRQYTFALENMWRSDVPPRVGMFVDVQFNAAGVPEALLAVPESQLAKEQAQRAFSGALEHGKTMRGGLLKRFGLASLITEVVLLLAFFALPNVTLGGLALTGWDMTGLNPATMMTNDHGLLSLLALVCLLAPAVVPFLRVSWALWLTVLPFCFALLNLLAVFLSLGRQSRATAAAIGDAFGSGAGQLAAEMNPHAPSLALGTYVVFLCALFFLVRAVRSTRSAPRLGLLLLCVSLFSLRASAQEALTAIRADYGGERASCRVRVDGLQSGRDMLGRFSAIKVIDGAVVHSFFNEHSNQVVRIGMGELVRVVAIDTVNNAKNDILRVTVLTHGVSVPLEYVLAKGSLAAMPEQQMKQVIGAVLELPPPVRPEQTAQTPAVPHADQGTPPAPARQVAPTYATRTPLDAANVAELNEILQRHNGDALVKIPGIRASMSSPNYVSDNFIVDNAFHPEMQGPHAPGMRSLTLWPNSQAQFLELTAFSDEEHDQLHLLLRSPLGAFAPITWLFPKGQLSTMSKREIMRAVDPVVVFAAADEDTFRAEPATHATRPHVRPAALTDDEAPITAMPALHASRKPEEGCRWKPYVNKENHLALLVQSCDQAHASQTADTTDLVASHESGKMAAITVFRKPAEQSLDTAVRAQVGVRLKKAAARGACHIVPEPKQQVPPGSKWVWYSFTAHGPAFQKVYQNADAGDELPCDPWEQNDNGVAFVYNPTISKTRFLYLITGQDTQPWDEESIVFLP